MSDLVFTFWEGKMPEYIKLCMSTWKFPYVVLNYSNLKQYTDFDAKRVQSFSLPQIADCIRIHTLKDNGGCWLDADTIILKNELPSANILGNSETRSNTIGFLRSDDCSEMFAAWASYQDDVLNQKDPSHHWSIFGNAFTDPYLKEHLEVHIGDIMKYWPELALVESLSRRDKYKVFYFEKHKHLVDIPDINMLMLHNSWTPDWYKKLSTKEILSQSCTLSNIFREVLCNIS